MDFTSDVSNLTQDEIFAFCANSEYLGDDIKEPLKAWKGIKFPQNLSFTAVYMRFRAIQRVQAQKEVHLRVRAAAIASQADVAILPTTITYKIDGATITSPIQRGYAVEAGHGLDIYKSQVSDAMAYMYTPPRTVTTIVADVPNNFTTGVAAAAIPRITTPAQVHPKEWKHDYSANVTTIMESISTMKGLAVATDRLKNILTTDPPLTSTPISETRKGMVLPKAFTPKITTGAKSEEQAYRVMSAHRAARGIDKKWISPLTSSYYYGVFDKLIDRVVWETADVLSIARIVGASSIFVRGKSTLKCSSYLSLAATEYPVYVQGVSLLSSKVSTNDKGSALPGVYTVSATAIPPPNSLIVIAGSTAQVTIARGGVDVPSVLTETLEAFSKLSIPHTCHMMTWTYLHDKMLDVHNLQYYPSVHVHAGHVLAYSGPSKIQQYDMPTLYNRFAVANCFKTWYPLSRVRFMEYDFKQYKISISAFWDGFCLRMRAPLATDKYDYYGAMAVAEVSDSFSDTSEIVFNTPIESMPTVVHHPPPPVPPSSPPIQSPAAAAPVPSAPPLQEVEDFDFSGLEIGDINDNPQ